MNEPRNPGNVENPKVLVVDDDPYLTRISQRALERAGFSVTVAGDGEEAVAAFNADAFDLVFSDIDMPRLDGIGLLRAIREIDQHLPVIMVTGNPQVETAISALNNGAVRYVTKPFEPQQLVTVAARAVGAGRLNRLRQSMAEVVAEQERAQARDRHRFNSALEQLYMVYQPIIHWPSCTVFGHEALVRTDEASIPHPGELFDVTERVGEVRRLSRRIRQLCADKLDDAPDGSSLFINLHAGDLDDPDLFDAASALAPVADRVVLEIAERASMANIGDAGKCIDKLRSMGFRVAIDDIGAGYAGLNSFAMLEPNIVKLDMVLVRDVNKSETKRLLIGSFTELCKSMNIPVVAEGVETQAELDTLVSLGCELYQGYFFARPAREMKHSI